MRYPMKIQTPMGKIQLEIVTSPAFYPVLYAKINETRKMGKMGWLAGTVVPFY